MTSGPSEPVADGFQLTFGRAAHPPPPAILHGETSRFIEATDVQHSSVRSEASPRGRFSRRRARETGSGTLAE